MSKLQALVPLLGWFYLTILGFVVFSFFAKNRFTIIRKVYYLFFGCIALIFALQSLKAEIQRYPETKKALTDTFEQKISYESGDYYSMYYETFRPKLTRDITVYLLNTSAREYHYARMYLYPAGVVPVEELPAKEHFAIVDTKSISSLSRNSENISDFRGKSLLKIGEK